MPDPIPSSPLQTQQDFVTVADTALQAPATQTPVTPSHCPSFDEEPWKSRADQYRPPHFADKAFLDLTKSYPPLPSQHPYVRLLLEFLDTVPKDCWVDEENEVD